MPRLFHEGFRIFFLSATVFAAVAIGCWTLHLATGGTLPQPFSMSPGQWHAHEMIFGFGGAAMGGFFLTAVPNWTGAKAAPHQFIAGVFALWLAGRAAMWASAYLPPWLVALACLSFLPVLAAKILTQLLARPKPQNMMFFAVLSALWLAELLCQLDWMGFTATAGQGLLGGLMLTVALIAVLGGRVTPAFTRNAMVRAGVADSHLPVTRAWAERAGIGLPLAAALLAMAGIGGAIMAVVAIAAGLVTALRLSGWRSGWTRGQPILWSLHLAYAMAAAGLIAEGLAAVGILPQLAATHIMGIGAVGGMVLAVMSRATLGHSGRPLIAPAAVAIGYAMLPLAMVLRLADLAAPGQGFNVAAGLVWALAFALAAAALWPAWTGPRADTRAPAAA